MWVMEFIPGSWFGARPVTRCCKHSEMVLQHPTMSYMDLNRFTSSYIHFINEILHMSITALSCSTTALVCCIYAVVVWYWRLSVGPSGVLKFSQSRPGRAKEHGRLVVCETPLCLLVLNQGLEGVAALAISCHVNMANSHWLGIKSHKVECYFYMIAQSLRILKFLHWLHFHWPPKERRSRQLARASIRLRWMLGGMWRNR